MRLANRAKALGDVVEHGQVSHGDHTFPIISFQFGTKDKKAPTLVFVAGVHGLEKIGTQILTAYLESFVQLLSWDYGLQESLKKSRIVFYPIVNPVGMYLNQRSNGQGIDLMRNGFQDASDPVPPLMGGHRLSPLIPWYRGKVGEGLQIEAELLCELMREFYENQSPTIALDVHSGFGLKDSLWFPYAGNSQYFPEASRILAMKKLLDRSFGHHTYSVEPQHVSYKTHGDLWDHMLNDAEKLSNRAPFIPLTLEMGSWTWVRKNPRQVFSRLGLFNPILPHRIKRAERRHFILFNFLVKIIASPEVWAHLPTTRLRSLEKQARKTWYT